MDDDELKTFEGREAAAVDAAEMGSGRLGKVARCCLRGRKGCVAFELDYWFTGSAGDH